MFEQVRNAFRSAPVQQITNNAWTNNKSNSILADGEKKAANIRQRHQAGPTAVAERKDAVKEYMERREKSTPPIRAGLPKFTNIYEYLRHAPEEHMIDVAKASTTPGKQRSKQSKHNETRSSVKPEEDFTESLSEGWIDVAATLPLYSRQRRVKEVGDHDIPKAKHPPRKSVEPSSAAPQQSIDMQASCKTSKHNDIKSPMVPGFGLHTEEWPSLPGIL